MRQPKRFGTLDNLRFFKYAAGELFLSAVWPIDTPHPPTQMGGMMFQRRA